MWATLWYTGKETCERMGDQTETGAKRFASIQADESNIVGTRHGCDRGRCCLARALSKVRKKGDDVPVILGGVVVLAAGPDVNPE